MRKLLSQLLICVFAYVAIPITTIPMDGTAACDSLEGIVVLEASSGKEYVMVMCIISAMSYGSVKPYYYELPAGVKVKSVNKAGSSQK